MLIWLLERTGSSDQKSVVFKKLGEAYDFQSKHGGKIHKLTEYELSEDAEEEEKLLHNEHIGQSEV